MNYRKMVFFQATLFPQVAKIVLRMLRCNKKEQAAEVATFRTNVSNYFTIQSVSVIKNKEI